MSEEFGPLPKQAGWGVDSFGMLTLFANNAEKKAGMYPGASVQVFTAAQMRAYAAQAVAAERERCAKKSSIEGQIGAVLTYRCVGRNGVCGMTLGASGEGDFAILFTGSPEEAEDAAAEYLRRLLGGGYHVTSSIIVVSEQRWTGESIRTVSATAKGST